MWSHQALRAELRKHGINDDVIWRKIEDIVIKTIISAEPYMFQATKQYVPYSDNCFELVAFEILIDRKLEPWLINVNLSSSLDCDTVLEQKIKSNLVADLFTLIGVRSIEKRQLSKFTQNASFKS